MKFWSNPTDGKRKILVIPNITNSRKIEADSFIDVLHNHIEKLGDEFFWHIPLPEPVKRLAKFENVQQHIIQMSGNMIWMRNNLPLDLIKLMHFQSGLDYDVVYSHLPDWPVGRFTNKPIVGYCHWWEFTFSNGISNLNRWLNFEHEILGTLQMERLYVNTFTQKQSVMREAGRFFNDNILMKLDDIIQPFYLNTDANTLVQAPTPFNKKAIVFNHRLADYKGWPKFYKFLKKYREKRQDFVLWVSQAGVDGSRFDESWIISDYKPKEDYLNALSNFRVCVTPVEHHHGWSLSATDAMTKGCPVLFGECDNYREINPNGMFYNNDAELEEMLDKLLDDDDYQFGQAQQCLGRAYELSDTGHFNELKALLLDADLKPKNYKDI